MSTHVRSSITPTNTLKVLLRFDLCVATHKLTFTPQVRNESTYNYPFMGANGSTDERTDGGDYDISFAFLKPVDYECEQEIPQLHTAAQPTVP